MQDRSHRGRVSCALFLTACLAVWAPGTRALADEGLPSAAIVEELGGIRTALDRIALLLAEAQKADLRVLLVRLDIKERRLARMEEQARLAREELRRMDQQIAERQHGIESWRAREYGDAAAEPLSETQRAQLDQAEEHLEKLKVGRDEQAQSVSNLELEILETKTEIGDLEAELDETTARE